MAPLIASTTDNAALKHSSYRTFTKHKRRTRIRSYLAASDTKHWTASAPSTDQPNQWPRAMCRVSVRFIFRWMIVDDLSAPNMTAHLPSATCAMQCKSVQQERQRPLER